MTRAPHPRVAPLLLATDLDGTFAGGADPDRQALYTRLGHRARCTLCYATGRHLESAWALEDAVRLPRPDYYIADVGATVASGERGRPIGFPESDLLRRWPGADHLRGLLAALETALEPQRLPTDRRLSFVVREGCAFGDTVRRVRVALAESDVEVIGSADTYVDILPGGVNKGSTLQRVVQWLGVDSASVVVAGDSLNDLALFEAGFKGIVVGNAEPPLRQAVERLPQVYRADGHGARGVHEGLRFFGFLDGEGLTAGGGV